MSNEASWKVATEQRRESRLPLEGPLRYRYGSGEDGAAQWRTVCVRGASIGLGRYLSPGRRILLVADIPWAGVPAEFKARVVWCRPEGQDHHFEAGIAIYNDEAETARVLSMLVAQAHLAAVDCTLC